MGTLTFYPLSGFPEFTEGMDLAGAPAGAIGGAGAFAPEG